MKKGVHSCASLTSHLLHIGGIGRYLDNLPIKENEIYFYKKLHEWIAVTPRGVEKIAAFAKQQEDAFLNENKSKEDNEDKFIPKLK